MDENCTVNLTVKYLTKKWTLLIILEIYKGENHTRRFSELKDKLGVIGDTAASSVAAIPQSSASSEAVAALTSLGFSASEAASAVAALPA
ncbi:MAG TPA: hypothetical protein O0X31_05270, partial [Methanocorpusculum sp.]|nr:hypothetical protein [Methanocorpusculum sp.]